ncbi:succinoglycan biosynthesis protein exoa [Microbacterium sorbitolivorans]|uniref:Glycosyltransferase family 2 protein n=2 Tax=Microbacterium sorbitolivorans TaxID=1867410 RepID=A0A367Y8G6_9MICO|nr:glycosyltransferase family 2 protein [Microbacterium sorbitolivorans]GGF44325.1 succinoglycan biosynthesis protein exoa [Microbacterium sorbitolivorans]
MRPQADRRDAPVVPAGAGVSYIMPVLNEVDYLEDAVASTLAQEVDGPIELVIALAPSDDGTTELARELAAKDPRIILVDNPASDNPVGLNLCIRASQYPTIVRVDAHSELSPGYTMRALETLNRTRAANVGGTMHAEGRTPFQRAVAAAYNSKIGLGGGAYHGSGQESEADSAYLGVMRREAVEEIGMFDETLRRGSDWEMNLRLRQAGYRVMFDPKLSVAYWPRESWSQLSRQFLATGRWRGELVRRYGFRNSTRYFAPPALVVMLTLGLLVAGLRIGGALRGVLAGVLSLIFLPIALYALVIAGYSALQKKASLREKIWSLAVVPTMHVAWGAGFIVGVVRGARDTIDTSRVSR